MRPFWGDTKGCWPCVPARQVWFLADTSRPAVTASREPPSSRPVHRVFSQHVEPRPSPRLTGARVGVRAPSRGSLCRRRGGGAGTALRPSLPAIDGAAGLSWLRPGSVHRGPTSSQAWEGDVSASSAAGSLCSRAGRAARVLLGCRLSNTSCSNVLQPPAFFLRFHRFLFTVKPSSYAALLREGVCSQAASCAPTVRVSRCLSFLSPRR